MNLAEQVEDLKKWKYIKEVELLDENRVRIKTDVMPVSPGHESEFELVVDFSKPYTGTHWLTSHSLQLTSNPPQFPAHARASFRDITIHFNMGWTWSLGCYPNGCVESDTLVDTIGGICIGAHQAVHALTEAYSQRDLLSIWLQLQTYITQHSDSSSRF